MQWIGSRVWNPSDSGTDTHFPRLGLLACAHADGAIRIWSIPHPSSLVSEALENMCAAAPIFTFRLENASLWRLKMNPHLSFPFLMGATTDGRVGIWNLGAQEISSVEQHVLEMPVHKQG